MSSGRGTYERLKTQRNKSPRVLPYLSHAQRTDRARQGKEEGEDVMAEFKEIWRGLRHITAGHLLPFHHNSFCFLLLSILKIHFLNAVSYKYVYAIDVKEIFRLITVQKSEIHVAPMLKNISADLITLILLRVLVWIGE